MNEIELYSKSIDTQMKRGIIVYAVLSICASHKQVYTAEIIQQLKSADLLVVEGTLYPLLSRLIKDGLLEYEWQESEQGPPRKYFIITTRGRQVLAEITKMYTELHSSITKITKG